MDYKVRTKTEWKVSQIDSDGDVIDNEFFDKKNDALKNYDSQPSSIQLIKIKHTVPIKQEKLLFSFVVEVIRYGRFLIHLFQQTLNSEFIVHICTTWYIHKFHSILHLLKYLNLEHISTKIIKLQHIF